MTAIFQTFASFEQFIATAPPNVLPEVSSKFRTTVFAVGVGLDKAVKIVLQLDRFDLNQVTKLIPKFALNPDYIIKFDFYRELVQINGEPRYIYISKFFHDRKCQTQNILHENAIVTQDIQYNDRPGYSLYLRSDYAVDPIKFQWFKDNTLFHGKRVSEFARFTRIETDPLGRKGSSIFTNKTYYDFNFFNPPGEYVYHLYELV